MSDEIDLDLTELLRDGWSVVGYSVCLMSMGATSHHVLLQKGTSLRNQVVVINSGEELGRSINTFAPAPPKKKGWFG